MDPKFTHFDDEDFDWGFQSDEDENDSDTDVAEIGEPEDDTELDSDDETLADEFGTEVDLSASGLSEDSPDSNYSVVTPTDDFIDNEGNIVVMDNNNPDDNKRFETAIIPIENISIAADRIRKESSNYEALYKSIKSTGLLEPIVVAPTMTEGYYVLLHGFKRLMACARCGMTKIPCTINNRVKTSEIPILEALYNLSTKYKMKEIVDYIEYLEKEKGIMSSSLIEYLTQMNSGDYNKLKDILEDNDPDILEKLLNDEISIGQAFKQLENKRKKQSREEKETQQAAKAYDENKEEGETLATEAIEESGATNEEDIELSPDEVKKIWLDPTKLDDNIDDEVLDDMVQEGNSMEGFEPHRQDWRDRERIDPGIRKAVMSRDRDTCQCCKRGGPDYVGILDLHHIVEVFLGGEDSVENSIALCLNCHRQVHDYAYGRLHIPKSKTPEELELDANKEVLNENAQREKDGKPKMTPAEEESFKESYKVIYHAEQNKYKRIVKLGNVIREGMRMRGISLDKAKKEHPIDMVGRNKPGEKNQRG